MAYNNALLLKDQPPVVFLQSFPEEHVGQTTNKFAVSFSDNIAKYSIDELRQLFVSKFQPISEKPDTFQIWWQSFSSGRRLTFIMVDMERAKETKETVDLIAAARDLLAIIRDEPGFVLRKNNMDFPLGIELPCGCDQPNSPFPTRQQIPKTRRYVPIPGKWHDPNTCQTPQPSSRARAGNPGGLGMPIHTKSREDVQVTGFPPPASSIPTVAGPSTTFLNQESIATPPTGQVMYPSRIEYPTPAGARHPVDVPQVNYTALPHRSFTANEVRPRSSHRAPVALMAPSTDNAAAVPTGSPFEATYNVVPNMDEDILVDGSLPDASVSAAIAEFAADMDYLYLQNEEDQNGD
ncbi:hypothetical protein F5Y09DRAFT_357918 [Xylaria sp. FL1042]|nr:hypothetical protein F5Y09DRAFT_357918 [Xylaria sp. FL1042]